MKKLNNRLKKQYISDDRPIGLNVTIKSTNGNTHEEYLTYIDLISYSRKHGLNDRLSYVGIVNKMIENWNNLPQCKKDQRKIIHIYEVYETKMYIKLKT